MTNTKTTTKASTGGEASTAVAAEPKATTQKPTAQKPVVPKKVDPHQIVSVRNGFQGVLVYKSPRTGEMYIWEQFGDEQDMEISELRNARNSAKAFFINNWFCFDEQWIVEYLGVGQYYKYALKVEDFDKILMSDVETIDSVISELSEGQKRSIAYRAKELIASGQIDSNKVIKALEACLGVELIER